MRPVLCTWTRKNWTITINDCQVKCSNNIMFHKYSEKTKFVVCRVCSFILGLVPTISVLIFSLLRLMVYCGVCDKEDSYEKGDYFCEFTGHWVGSEGVTFHLIFIVFGMVFCFINTALNIVFYYIQSKVVIGSWLTWTFLCSIGHIIISFEQNVLGPLSWVDGGFPNILNIIYQVCLVICWFTVFLVQFGRRLTAPAELSSSIENVPLQQLNESA